MVDSSRLEPLDILWMVNGSIFPLLSKHSFPCTSIMNDHERVNAIAFAPPRQTTSRGVPSLEIMGFCRLCPSLNVLFDITQ